MGRENLKHSRQAKVNNPRGGERLNAEEREVKNRPSYLASIGKGDLKNLSPFDKLTGQILSIIGKEGINNFSDAYDYYKKQGQKLPNKSLLKGRLLQRVESMEKEGVIDSKQLKHYKELYNIDTDPSGDGAKTNTEAGIVDRTISGVAKTIGKVDTVVQDIFGTDTDAETKNKKDATQRLTDEEMFYKGYNSEINTESANGVNLPMNIAGFIGEQLPEFVAGGGVGTIAKKGATQLVGDMAVGGVFGAVDAIDKLDSVSKLSEGENLKDVVIETAIATGASLIGATPSRAGITTANVLDKSKPSRIISEGMERVDLHNTIKGKELIEEGSVKIPHVAVSDGVEAQKLIESPKTSTQTTQVKEAFDTAETSVAKKFDESLDDLGTSRADLENTEVGKGMGQDPVAKQVYDEFATNKKKFKDKAKPFTEKYEEVGKDLQVDIDDIISDSYGYTTKASKQFQEIVKSVTSKHKQIARQDLLKKGQVSDLPMFQKQLADELETIKILKTKQAKLQKEMQKKGYVPNKADNNKLRGYGNEVKEREAMVAGDKGINDKLTELDRAPKRNEKINFSANQLDDMTRQLGEEIRSADASFTHLGATDINDLQQIYNSFKVRLNNLDPSFSNPYKESKRIYADMFKLSGDKTVVGNVKKAMDKFKTSGDLSGVRSLIENDGGLLGNNIDKLTQVIPRSSKAYQDTFREAIEKRADDVRQYSKSGVFNFEKYADVFGGVDFEKLKKYAPRGLNSKKALDNLAGIKGISQDMLDEGGSVVTNTGKRNKALSEADKGKGTMKDLITSVNTNMPVLSNWWEDLDSPLMDMIKNKLDILRAPMSRKFRPGKAKAEKAYFQQLLDSKKLPNEVNDVNWNIEELKKHGF